MRGSVTAIPSVSASKPGLDLEEDFPSPDKFRELLRAFPHDVLAKRYIVSGMPFIFRDAPLNYISFNEVLANRLDVGHHDLAIVGSARIGFSLSQREYGRAFAMGSDVDVVVVSPSLFSEFQRRVVELIAEVHPRGAELEAVSRVSSGGERVVDLLLSDWKSLKMATEQLRYGYIGPNLLPDDDPLKQRVFSAFNETSTHLLAMKPPGPVSKVRGRIFATWKDAEANYTGSLRTLARDLARGRAGPAEPEPVEADLLKDETDA